LGKKGFVQARATRQKRYAPGTVMALRPSQPLTVVPHTTVAEASQIMAAKREDCVLVIDEEHRLSGIFTAKDLAFRVVGQGIDARDVLIKDIMTENPICARQSSPATEALEIMVRRGFRHMPVLDEDGDILGILDITKCFYEAMEKVNLMTTMTDLSLNEHMRRLRNSTMLSKVCRLNGEEQYPSPSRC
jgi:CBS domain-containing protein